jgi:hypothetical protein
MTIEDVIASKSPTRSPIIGEGGNNDQGNVVKDTCPVGYTGNKAINGCSGYIYCLSGTQLGKFECLSGTRFDVSLGYCNWAQNVNIDIPECAKSSNDGEMEKNSSAAGNATTTTTTTATTTTTTNLESKDYYPD